MPTSKGMLARPSLRICKLLLLLTLFPVASWAQGGNLLIHTPKVPPPTGFVRGNYTIKAGSLVPLKSKTPVESVDLSGFFLENVAQQQVGSCHIYAATALIEAFCKKVTGVKIDISESYYFYRHLRNSFNEESVNSLSSPDLIRRVEGGNAGDIENTFTRFKNGSVCTTSEFPLTEWNLVQITGMVESFAKDSNAKLRPGYLADVDRAMKSCNSQEELDRRLKLIKMDYTSEFQAQICEKVDGQVRCRVSKKNIDPSYQGEGVVQKTTNPNLQKCVDQFDEAKKIEKPTADQMISLLKQGSPFTCNGRFVFAPGSRFDATPRVDTGGHALIIYGYRKDPKTKRVEFMVRDSNFTALQPYTVTGCDYLMVMKQKPAARKPAGK